MKSMKKFWLVMAITLVGLALGASGVLGAQLSLDATHVLTTSFTGSGGAVDPTGGYITSGVYGIAQYNPTENPSAVADTRPITFGTADTSSSSLGGGFTWLQNTTTSTAYDGGTQFTMTQNYVGNAPAPSVPMAYDGYLAQYNSYYYSNYFQLTYTVPADGDYTAKVSDLYSLVFKLVNGAGSGNYFYSTNGYSYLYAYVYASTGQGSFQKQVLADYRYNYPDAVPDFTVSDLNKTASLNLTLEDLVAGSDVTFEGYIYAEQYGNSNVPLPPTAMLLGSGLVGLALLRRRWSLKK